MGRVSESPTSFAVVTAIMSGTIIWREAEPSMANTVMLISMRVTPPNIEAAPTIYRPGIVADTLES